MIDTMITQGEFCSSVKAALVAAYQAGQAHTGASHPSPGRLPELLALVFDERLGPCAIGERDPFLGPMVASLESLEMLLDDLPG